MAVERAEQLRQILVHLVEGRDRWGAAVVSRDGIAVAARMTRPVSEESFCAMAAAALGASESAMAEWADDRPRHATIDGVQLRLTLSTLDNDFFLVLVTPVTSTPNPTHALEIDAAAVRLRSVLKGQLVTA